MHDRIGNTYLPGDKTDLVHLNTSYGFMGSKEKTERQKNDRFRGSGGKNLSTKQ